MKREDIEKAVKAAKISKVTEEGRETTYRVDCSKVLGVTVDIEAGTKEDAISSAVDSIVEVYRHRGQLEEVKDLTDKNDKQ